MSFPVVQGVEVMMEAPAGYHVDFANPYRDWSTINSTYWAFAILYAVALFFLGSRLYTAHFVLRKWQFDDFMLVGAWLMTSAAQFLILRCLSAGVLGVHIWEMSLDDAIWETTLIHATTLTVIPGTVLAKLTLCAFYFRVSPATWYRYSIGATAGVTVVSFAAVWLLIEFACDPIEAAWNLRVATPASCISRPPVYMTQAIMGGVTDVMLMGIPLPTILSLQLSWKQKLALLAWFGTGLLTLGASVARLVILIPSLTDSDTTYVLAQGTLWLVVESNLIIICGALPTFRLFLNHVSPKLLSEASRYGGGRGSSSNNNNNKKKPGGGGGSNRTPYSLKTIGQLTGRRRHFGAIDDTDIGDEYYHEVRAHGPNVDAKSYVDVESRGGSGGGGPPEEWSPIKSPSGNSDEEAIVKTVQTSVTFQPA